jgi:hypothetical protein
VDEDEDLEEHPSAGGYLDVIDDEEIDASAEYVAQDVRTLDLLLVESHRFAVALF